MEIDVCDQLTDENLSELAINKKRKSTEDQLPSESTSVSSPTNDCSNIDCSPDSGTPGKTDWIERRCLCLFFIDRIPIICSLRRRRQGRGMFYPQPPTNNVRLTE